MQHRKIRMGMIGGGTGAPSSFSSSTKVLVDEIKFRIDNQLP